MRKHNLIFNMTPADYNDMWLRHVRRLLPRLSLFDRVIMSVGQGERMIPLEWVRNKFIGYDVEFLTHQNNPETGEAAGYLQMLPLIKSLDAQEATLYAHSKGITKPNMTSVWFWTDMMYIKCFDLEKVDAALEQHVMAGCYQADNGHAHDPESRWHYSGTFYWFRHDYWFSHPGHTQLASNRWGVESLPGRICPIEAAASLHQPRLKNPCLYDYDEWRHPLVIRTK